jgi:hypothetical protein
MKNPVVFVALKVKPAKFDLSSLTANLGHLVPPMHYEQDIVVRVDDALVAPSIDVRARLKSVRGKVRARLLVWSSAFGDDPSTPVDERWKELDVTKAPSDEFIVLEGRFDPTQGI